MPSSLSKRTVFLLLAVLILEIDNAAVAASLDDHDLPAQPEQEDAVTASDGDPDRVDPNTLGCILPLSGKFTAYGNRALESMILAAGLFDPQKKSPLRLLIEDSQSRPDKARAAVAGLVREGAVAIIGPLGSEEALEAAQEAQRLKVPLLALTRKEVITKSGDYVFRTFLSGSQQIEGLVKFARDDLQLQRYAVLYPATPYARKMAGLFRRAVIRHGGTIVWAGPYVDDETDFDETVKKLTDATEIARVEDDVPGSPSRSFSFEALFIPDSYNAVKMIVPRLANYNVGGIRLLGMRGWNSPELLNVEEPDNLEDAVFTDIFFAGGVYQPTLDFVDRFYIAYGREPNAMEAEVFDAVGMAVKIIAEKKEGLTRENFRNSLMDISSYPGVTGPTSLSTRRFVEKEPFVLMVKDGRIVQVER